MDIVMNARGATPEDKQRGIDAATAVLQEAGITAEDAADGSSAVEGWDDMGFPPDQEPSEDEYAAAEAWWAASRAAMEACCAGWSDERKRDVCGLELLRDPELQLADHSTAITMMRVLTQAEDGKAEYCDDRVFLLALAATRDMADGALAQELVNAVSAAYTQLSLAGFTPNEPIEPKRNAALSAIDALEAGSAPRH